MNRRHDLDAARGLMLVLMTLTHLPTRWSDPLGQPFGYVSAAEGFVMLSGYMAGMVYGQRALEVGVPAMRQALLSRALKIYGCQAALLLFLFTFIAVLGLKVDQPAVKNLMSFYLHDPLTALWTALLLIYNPPLLDILPLYIVFMLASPWLLAYALSPPRDADAGAPPRGWNGVLLASIALWAVAQFGAGHVMYQLADAVVGMPVPQRETGAFETCAWQFLWVLGLAMGSAGVQPDHTSRAWPRWLLHGALAYALLCMVWRHVVGQTPFPDGSMWNLLFDKWKLGPMRLLDFFALLLLAMHYGPALMARLPRMKVLEQLGSASLPVFCAQLVMVLLGLALVGEPHPDRDLIVDVGLLVASFAVLYLVALISEQIDRYAAALKARIKTRQQRRAPQPAAPRPGAH